MVEVHNTGSHLTPDELAHVFDRFYRADPLRQRASGGTGLGLSIVKNLIEAQGGASGREAMILEFPLPLRCLLDLRNDRHTVQRMLARFAVSFSTDELKERLSFVLTEEFSSVLSAAGK